MTRWDYDTVFYRVFCTALLGVALTFTVILTNVFMDIDGLLHNKDKAILPNTAKLETITMKTEDVITNFKTEADVSDYKEYGESYAMERTKRSLEMQDFSFQIKDPKIKKVITNRLTALLEDLDKEESSKTNHKQDLEVKIHPEIQFAKKDLQKMGKYTEIDVETTHNDNNVIASVKGDVELLDTDKKSVENEDIEFFNDIRRIKNEKETKQQSNYKEDELRHLAIHNIILQGIIGHVDLGDVYTKVHALISNMEAPAVKDSLKGILHPAQDHEFFNELTNCKQLKNEIVAETAKTKAQKYLQTKEDEIKKIVKPSGRNVMIKTIIDITSLANDKTNQDDTTSKENLNGMVKLIYNGKLLKFKRVDEGITTPKQMVLNKVNENVKSFANREDNNIKNIRVTEDKILGINNPQTQIIPNMKHMINDYLKRFIRESGNNANILTTKRLKRHVEIMYENEETTKTTLKPPKKDQKNGDDELYVEIETHFDSKGLKGEQKNQMIRDLVEKIQKAIHSDKEVKKKKHKHLHVKKRTQNPLDSENPAASFVSKMTKPILNSLVHRELNPISKSVPLDEKLPHVSDNNGDQWRRFYNGPKFLTGSKTINSAEMNELVTDYNKVMDNGIPQRLLKPLNTDIIGETVQDQENANMMIKNIPGSGFSIGFNQYVDQPPDAETIKLFTGIENIIQTYHQNYDDDTNAENTNANVENMDQGNLAKLRYTTNLEQSANQEYPTSETDDHLIVRRSIQKIKQDYHSNAYKVFVDKNLKYDNYQDIYNKGVAKKSKARNMKSAFDDIFNQDLKPADIFNLADLLERQKRSFNIKKFTNLKSKEISRYLNTKSMASKKIFQQNKRNKRQINKIRIIAKDLSKKYKHNSDEEVFIVSDDKLFADRAILKEVETPDMEPAEHINEEHYDLITPQKSDKEHYDNHEITENHFDIISPQNEKENRYDDVSPYIFDTPSIETNNENNFFTRISRHNLLSMSKYPHIIMDEITKSKEGFLEESPLTFGKVMSKVPVEISTQIAPLLAESPGIQYNSPQEKSNYKVTVKIMPKNNTGLNSGFKEIHTSINKSYNKNGLVYTSLVNVSEISKVEKINKTKEANDRDHSSVKKLKREQLKVKSMIQQHKDRIEEQLAHLNKEKEKLNRIDIRNAEIIKDMPKDIPIVDVALQTNPTRTLHLTKEDLGRLLHFEESKPTEQPLTTVLSTTEHITPLTEDLEKINIKNTIERNENITNEILKKIDKNTNILQMFLYKLINKMEAPQIETTPNPEEPEKIKTVYKNVNNNEEQKPKSNSHIPRTIEMYSQYIPNIFLNPKDMYINGSAGIPFVYAFQKPYNMPNSDDKDTPITSVVYQGHIHAETVNQKPELEFSRRRWKEKDAIKVKSDWKSDKFNSQPTIQEKPKNSTKFFIDGLQNEFKVLPILGKNVYPGILNNTKAHKS